jgi:hypothetical protein
MLTAVFDKLAGRMRQRTLTAHEAIEAAAKAIAAGQAADVAALEEHLFGTGTSLDQFKGLCESFAERIKKFSELDALAAARRRVEKVEKDIEAATKAHAEATERYQQRHAALRVEAAEANVIVSMGQAARDWLVDPKNCPPSVRPAYAEALDNEQVAQVAVGDAEREVRRLTDEIRSEAGWLTQLLGEDAREIHPPEIAITQSGRDRLTAARRDKYDEHAARKKRLEARLVEANKAVEAARAALVDAEAAVAAIRKKILAV